jgi:hypothetical protein
MKIRVASVGPCAGLLSDVVYGFGLVAILIIALRTLPRADGSPSVTAGESAHETHCRACRLPSVGRPGEPSIHGPDARDEVDVEPSPSPSPALTECFQGMLRTATPKACSP